MNRIASVLVPLLLCASGPALAGDGSDTRRGVEPSLPPLVAPGRCGEREQLGRVIGGAAGALIGAQIGEGTDRKIAMVGGAVIGSLVGAHVGRSIDEADRACTWRQPEPGRTASEAWRSPA